MLIKLGNQLRNLKPIVKKQVKEEIESKTNNVQNVDELKKQVNEILNRKVNPESSNSFIDDSVIIEIIKQDHDKDYWTINELHVQITEQYHINIGRIALRFRLDNMVERGILTKSKKQGTLLYSTVD
jgi:hypothetical protein